MANETRQKKQPTAQWIAVPVYLLVGVICARLFEPYRSHMAALGGFFPSNLMILVVLLFLLYAGILIQIVVHESGHLVFGLLTGYRFCSFRVFHFIWIKENGSVRLKRMQTPGTAGQCLMAPPPLRADGTMPALLFNYGGVLLNLLSAAVFWGIALLLPDLSPLRLLLLFCAVPGLALALLNGLPFHMGPSTTDGQNGLYLLRSKAASSALWVQLTVLESIANGVRIKDMPADWFSVPADTDMKNGLLATLGVLFCSRLMDEHRFAEAELRMAHLLSLDSALCGLHRAMLTCDRMYVELRTENRPDVLDALQTREQKKYMKSMRNAPSVLRTEYALALLSERDSERAEAVRERFEARGKTYPYPSELPGERELMDLALARACAGV